MGHIQGANRHEEIQSPERLDASIAVDNPGRFIAAVVDDLTIEARGFPRANPAATGRPASHPADLLQRYMYGSLSRLRARRRLAQAPPRHVELLGLLQTLRPAPKTSADVRQHTLQPLRQVCRACTLLGKPLALLAGALVAMDGSTCKAVHATERHVTRDQLQRRRGPSDQRGEDALAALDRRDTPEEAGPPGGARAENFQARLPCRFATVARGRHLRSYATAACKPWALQPQGTRHTGGRRLTRRVEEPLWDAMAQRVRRRPKVRKPRTQWVEHPCGTMQRWWEQGDCLRRGVEKGRTECRVTVLADNLRRVVNMGGIPQRMAALGEVVVLVWSRLTGKDGMEDKARL